ncbi:hypothetical protein Cst_c14610 [Thermoclostridium stercorarium subsp. stercorarium DSM 8532]|jgi:phosphopantetheine adenylyltransferase|uniref:Uncharacterized protein n=3 Tax=Thermoclostridium stercorarium TaxID=1510 RepID=L7VJZ2_THES1|nr:hypothetical protein [Thermoclostridium stercorarium]AGC68450.1 hypothetical protein Cst_c14610 [Thermoclostridium stercorarium subsp. stercorarium DSM 8532]AGI39469.1 hypothetical protein Clst_1410 [Thermoclostridium stercorarium subsp. stercorarium DSM 8532]ANW98817.1 hypothetical protein CSTERTH_07160 [Thermoclostridium stercorarium subsp. thermolacticum DSM 2910]ANX01341.1 hypothetical protein CSTERLE_07050 [Thermoclostridium stercorarium subsp. leptospartum DSM 9219]UZQ84446.1 hypothet
MSEEQRSAEKAIDGKEELKMANERRIEELLNINNRYVRTERHLEQHADIADPENVRHSEKVQQERLKQMENLKNIIVYGKHEQEDQVENLKKRIEYTDGYLRNNADKMDEETLENTLEKQEHRREQLDFLS